MFSTIKRFVHYGKESLYLLVISLILALVGNALIMLCPFVIGLIIEQLTEGNVNLDKVYVYLGILASFYVAGSILRWISQILSNKYSSIVCKNLRVMAYEGLLHTSNSYLDGANKGDVIIRFSYDIDNIYDAISNYFIQIFIAISTIIIATVMLLVLNGYLALIVFVGLIIVLIYSKLSKKHNKKFFDKLAQETATLNNLTTDYLNNRDIIYTNGYESKAIKKYQRQNKKTAIINKVAYFNSSIYNPSYRLINNIIYAILGLVSIFMFYNNIYITIGILTSVIMYSQVFNRPFNDFSVLQSNFLLGDTSLKRIEELINLTKDHDYYLNNKVLNHNFEGKVEFKNVSFSYNKDKELIKDFNLTVNPGEKVAIVGPTGCGKTTLINLLMRFYKIDSGNIIIDNIDIKKYNKKELNQAFGLVLQNPILFNLSIKDNLQLGNPNCTNDELVNACIQANCYEYIMNLKDGFDTIVDDKLRLSLGVMQLLTIARVLICNPKILILDEATSNIDSLMENKIIETFNKVLKGRTTFVIAHRLKSVIDSDKIIVMKDGKIIEIGNHTELMKENGFYKELYDSQYE